MADYSSLTLTIDGHGVANVTLNRPQLHNAFNEELIGELTRVFHELDGNNAVRLAVLSGNGKSFCAGGDLNWMKSMKNFSEAENITDSQHLARMFAAIHDFTKPLIGVMQGFALGGGSGLAALCDYVIAADNATFGFTETRLGLVPATIAPFVMEKIGASAALAYFISGSTFPAQTAKDVGLAHKLVPETELKKSAAEIIAHFLKAGPEASRKAKLLVREVSRLSKHESRQELTTYTTNAIAHIRVSPEAQEGMSALLEKRKPLWSNG